MRQDIQDILKNRPSWILHTDEEYQQLLKGMAVAKKGFNHKAIAEFEIMLEARRNKLLTTH